LSILFNKILILLYSGAGIGWMGQLDSSSNTASTPLATTETVTESPSNQSPTNKAPSHQQLFSNILSPSTGPSPDYLQSLLNVNEALLAQSLAKTDTNNQGINTPLLTSAEEQLNSLLLNVNSPLITPKEDPSDYMGNIHPESEKIISSLSNDKQFELAKTTTNTANRSLFQH
jgi:hypothetical protein